MSGKRLFWVFVIVVFIFGFALRAVEVISGDFVFLFDQGRDYLDVSKIVIDKKITLIGPHTGIGGVFTGPGWYYFLAIPFWLWKGNPLGGQIFLLIGGLVTMALAFWVGLKIFNPWIGLLVLFFTAVSKPIFSEATMIWSPHLIPILLLLSFYFLYRYLVNRKAKDLLLTFLSIGLMYHLELTVTAACLIYTFFYLIVIDRKTKISNYLKSVIVLMVAFFPALVFETRHQFLQTKAFFNFLFGPKVVDQGPVIFNRLIQLDHLKSFTSNLAATFNLSGLTMTLFILLILLLIAWLYRKNYLTKPQKTLFVYFLLFPLFTFVLYLFFPNPVWQWYLTHLYFVYIFVASILIYYATKELKLYRIIFCLFLIMMVYSSFKILINRYKYDYFDRRGTAGFKTKLETIDYIYQDADQKNFNLLVFTPPIYDYAYRYLLNWYGNSKYHYVPGNDNSGLVYLWIEPDPSKPWTYQGWLETVVKNGEVIKEEKLSSGFIIQKRNAKK